MKIAFLPIDNRPVCYTLPKIISGIDKTIEFELPERRYLGDLTKIADIEKLFSWLENLDKQDVIILSLDTLIYGGLIPSRRSVETLDELKQRQERLKNILKKQSCKILAFSSIMRISNNNYNEEEKEYWSEYGKKIFEYSYNFHKSLLDPTRKSKISTLHQGEGICSTKQVNPHNYKDKNSNNGETCPPFETLPSKTIQRIVLREAQQKSLISRRGIIEEKYNYQFKTNIPQEILEDYLATRKRNFEINKIYLEWQKEGLFETLIFSKDDCAQYGLNVIEAQELEKLGGFVKTGADEIPMSLLSRAIQGEMKVYPVFLEDNQKHLISNYEDVSVEKSVIGQLELAGCKITNQENCDMILYVNNFKNHQGEIVMKVATESFSGKFELTDRPYMIADVRFANGSDNKFVEQVLKLDLLSNNFHGYSAWNTTANSLGSLICGAKVKFLAKNYDKESFLKLTQTRLLDDWAYQANIRQQIEKNDLKALVEKMKPYKKTIDEIFKTSYNNSYSFPWNRLFEVEVEFN